MENVVAQDRDNIATLINFSWATYHTTPLRMICAKCSSVMVESLNYAYTVNRTIGAKVRKAEAIRLEYLIMDLSRSRINRL